LPEFHENKVALRVIGDMDRLTPRLRGEIASAEAQTAQYKDHTLILMFSYSGKWDIEQAARRYALDFKDGEPMRPFESYLATAGIPDPDLLIRTGGEQRISNYMLWQCAYTEFYYTPVLWPDFRKTDLEQAIQSYNLRERRYGKVE
jgi:undecaprenyl diphosphate synthase